jgi:autotransporter passenger strand-loop-strand repeat protein
MTTYVVSGGQTASGITLNSGDTLSVLSGGSATSTTIDSGGLLTVSSGGIEFFTTISSGGSETASSGGSVVSGTILNGGSLVLSGDTDPLDVLDHGVAISETISSGGSLIVSAGGRARNTINNGGRETVFSAGSGGFDTIDSGGLLTVFAGGGEHDETIDDGGLVTVSSGGAMAGVTINGSGAVLDLRSPAFLGGGVLVWGGADFVSAAGGQLRIDGSAMPPSTISGFVAGDSFDLTSIAFDSRGSAGLASGDVPLTTWNASNGDFETSNVSSDNVLQITEGGTTYELNLDPAQDFTGDFFHLASDGSSGTLVTESTTVPPVASPAVLTDFSWTQDWESADYPRIVTDVNGDGTSDYVGFGDQYTYLAYGGTFSGGGSTGPGFSTAVAAVEDFGTSEGYTAADQRGAAAAGIGDGDILYGQGYAGIYWYEATGETTETDAAGNTYQMLQYQSSPNLYGNFGSNEGWTSDNGFQILKTTSTDATASILGFGDDGIVVGPDAFATGATAASSYVISFGASNNSGWDQTVDIRSFTDMSGGPIDLNGDGVADFVGMGPDGLVYAYGSDSGPGGAYELGALQTAHINGSDSDLGEAQGWTDATTVRDIVYDATTGYDDIIAFGAAGVYVSMGQDPTTHNGEPFGQLYLAMADFGSNQGWTVSGTPRLVGDVTGDGIPDIVGFGTSDTYVAVGSYDSNGNLQFKIDPIATYADFGSAEGWSGSTQLTVRALGTFSDVGGSHSDLVISGTANTQVWCYG